MLNVNRLTVLGNVGQDPKTLDSGVVKLSVATNSNYTDKKGKRQQATDWVPVTILSEKVAKWVAANVKKGDTVYIEARVSNSSYKDKQGETQWSVNVIANTVNLLSSADAGDEAETEQQAA